VALLILSDLMIGWSIAWAVLHWQWLSGLLRSRAAKRQAGHCTKRTDRPALRIARKPEWVRHEVLRLSALMPGLSRRKLSTVFNRMYCARRHTTVSKSWISDFLRDHRHELEVIRKDLRRRTPRAAQRNQVWGFDLTGKQDVYGNVHSILGIVDHGTRRAVILDVPQRKNAWTLLGYLFIAIGRFGRPRAIRTDNEAMFKSLVWRTILRLANIRHQLTVPGCPWMNGRVERFFGTLKSKLHRMQVDSRVGLAACLAEFDIWFNVVRTHSNLAGQTPVEAWDGVDPYQRPAREAWLFTAWDGLLTGVVVRR
jgi:putative transposase